MSTDSGCVGSGEEGMKEWKKFKYMLSDESELVRLQMKMRNLIENGPNFNLKQTLIARDTGMSELKAKEHDFSSSLWGCYRTIGLFYHTRGKARRSTIWSSFGDSLKVENCITATN